MNIEVPMDDPSDILKEVSKLFDKHEIDNVPLAMEVGMLITRYQGKASKKAVEIFADYLKGHIK